MCDVSRRQFLAGGAALVAAAAEPPNAAPAIGTVEKVTGDIYFHEGDLEKKGHCNNGWIVFEDYVLVIDANFPSGALDVIPKIKGVTQKPVRFAVDTHHHGDHAYGNQVWVDHGAMPVAHTGVVEEMKRYEPARWNDSAKSRPDVAASRLKAPSVLFPKELYFDDGKHRVELMHLGLAHTHGDAFAWLPGERILFTGDACVNGPYNFVADGSIEQWIKTLDAARKLGARIVCPGHGPRGDATVLEDQQLYFKELRERVGKLVRAKKGASDLEAAVDQVRGELESNKRIARYVSKSGIRGHVDKVFNEMTGQKLPAAPRTAAARHWHARQHGLERLA